MGGGKFQSTLHPAVKGKEDPLDVNPRERLGETKAMQSLLHLSKIPEDPKKDLNKNQT